MRIDKLVTWQRSKHAQWLEPQPGDLIPWVRWTIAAACAITVIGVAVAAHQLWQRDGHHRPLNWVAFRVLPPLAVGAAIATIYVGQRELSRFLRLALALPLIQAIAILAMWWINSRLGLSGGGEDGRTPMIDSLPVSEVLLAIAAATAIAALLIARKRRDWIHVAVTIALANLLLLGLWLPLATNWLVPRAGVIETWDLLKSWYAAPETVVPIVVLPPFLLACGFAVLLHHSPRAALSARPAFAMLLGVALLSAISARSGARWGSYSLYDNFAHVVLCSAAIAFLAVAMLAVTTWYAGRRRFARLDVSQRRPAVIDPDGDPVIARLEITSWLRGPRVIARPFVATTDRGIALQVPGDSEVAMSLPLETTTMKTGESIVVLQPSDPIELSGYVENRHGDGPFRGADIPVPGRRGIVIGRIETQSGAAASHDMALAAWRPAVAYLIILALAALPAVLGMMSSSWR